MGDDSDRVVNSPASNEAKVRAGSWTSLPAQIKESPLVSLLVLMGTGVIAFASFSDSAAGLFHSARDLFAPELSGLWVTPVLTNPYDKSDHSRLEFQFRLISGQLNGVVTEVEENGFRKGRRYDNPIIDGKADRDTFSFHTNFQIYGGGDDDKPQQHSEFYEGKISRHGLAIRRWNDVNVGDATIEAFEAKRSLQ